MNRLFGWLGRRYWLNRISAALNRAHEQGLIDSWLLHELDGRIKYSKHPGAEYKRPRRSLNAACEHGLPRYWCDTCTTPRPPSAPPDGSGR